MRQNVLRDSSVSQWAQLHVRLRNRRQETTYKSSAKKRSRKDFQDLDRNFDVLKKKDTFVFLFLAETTRDESDVRCLYNWKYIHLIYILTIPTHISSHLSSYFSSWRACMSSFFLFFIQNTYETIFLAVVLLFDLGFILIGDRQWLLNSLC